MCGEAGFLGFSSLRADAIILWGMGGRALWDGDRRPQTQIKTPCRHGCKPGVGRVRRVIQSKAVRALRAAADWTEKMKALLQTKQEWLLWRNWAEKSWGSSDSRASFSNLEVSGVPARYLEPTVWGCQVGLQWGTRVTPLSAGVLGSWSWLWDAGCRWHLAPWHLFSAVRLGLWLPEATLSRPGLACIHSWG